jgi:hypothetical protein
MHLPPRRTYAVPLSAQIALVGSSASTPQRRYRRSSAASDKCDHHVGGVPVEILSPAVIDRCCSGVGVACGDLHITQRYAGVERGNDEPGAEHVRVDGSQTRSSPMDRTDRWARCADRGTARLSGAGSSGTSRTSRRGSDTATASGSSASSTTADKGTLQTRSRRSGTRSLGDRVGWGILRRGYPFARYRVSR